MPEEDPRRRYTANLQGEVDSAALYRTLAQTEKNPQLAQVYRRLAAIEEAHAEYWKNHIAAIDDRVPKLRPGFRTRALAWLAQRLGPGTPGGPASRDGRKRAARRRARRQ